MAKSKYQMKRDANERVIINDLKSFGASVLQINKLDLIVGYNGITHLIEVKNPLEDWSVTPSQRQIINDWRGSPMHIVTSSDQAINILKRFR